MKLIDTLEKWNILKEALKEKGYSLFQMQFSYDTAEGFHAWFMKGSTNVEVVTHNKEVQEAIINKS